MVVGLLTFAKVLSYTFKKYPNPTLALLTGFLIGSLNKVWPWQQVTETRMNSKGLEVVKFSDSVLPSTFSELDSNFLYGNEPHLIFALVILVVAFVLVYLLDKFSLEE
jgi:putative membrane protein